MAMSIKEKQIAWKERCTIMCSCGDDIVNFYCNVKECPYNKSDPLFCISCISTCVKHDHTKPPMIYDKIMELDKAWNSQKEAFRKVNESAIQSYKELEPLIHYFEHEMLIISFSDMQGIQIDKVRHISDDLHTLNESQEEFRQFSAVAESLIMSGDVIKLLELEDHLVKF